MIYEKDKRIITIEEETSHNPIQLMGKFAGECWQANTEDSDKNYKRGLDCIKSGHGRVLEFPQIYLKVEGYSARFVREYYVHVGGAPTRLQASTRYIDYTKSGFDFVIPPAIEKDQEARLRYLQAMHHINEEIRQLIDIYEIHKEDAAMLLPLGMTSTFVVRTNARNLIDMSRQRCCNRAYHEYRLFMQHLKEALSAYDEEWKELLDLQFGAKCDFLGYCPEAKGCGKYPHKENLQN